ATRAEQQQSADISSTFMDFVISRMPQDWLPPGTPSYAALLKTCYQDARESLTTKYGPDPSKWTWGRASIVRFTHPLSLATGLGDKFRIAPIPIGGSTGTFPTINVGAVVSMRLIADPSDWDDTRQGITLGESGDPSSEHWTDQLEDWKNVTTRVFPFSQNAVESSAQLSVELVPQSH